MPDKTAHHPDGHHVIKFGEKWHTYTDQNGTSYTSGTKFVGQFFPKFDMVAMSEKCSAGENPKYKGREPEEIRAEWAAEGDRGRTEGTLVHNYAEGLMCGWSPENMPTPISERTETMFPHVKRTVQELRRRYEFVSAEMMLFSPDLRLAGQADIIMYEKETNTIIIGDYKNNKELTTENYWQKAFKPIEHLDDCSIAHYTLQLSAYRYLMEREGYFPGITNYRQEIIHLRPDGFEIIGLENYRYEIIEMVDAWRQK